MWSKSMLIALAAAPSALAHTTFVSVAENGKSFGDGFAMRMNPDASQAGSPIASLDSDDMACNVKGTTGVPYVAKVQDGSQLTFAIRSWADDPSKPSLDPGHKGPCAVYMKKVASAKDDKATGDGWFKVASEGYAGGKWCTDKVIENGGFMSFSLPKGLQGGDYLVRPEILALHAVAGSNDPQFYTGCAQVFLESKGDLVPESTVSIPGYVKKNQPGTSFNIYYGMDPNTYQVPGPAIAKLVSGSGSASSTQQANTVPDNCLLVNGNWCGKEIPDFSDSKGCWASTENCWNQNKDCWAKAGPTGGKGCKLWEAKCEAQSSACKANNFNGVLNKGKKLDFPLPSIKVGYVFPTQASGGSSGGNSSPPKSTGAASQPSAAPQYSAAPSSNTKPSSKAAVSSAKKVEQTPQPTVEDYKPAPTPTGRPTTIVVPVSEGKPAPTGFRCPRGMKCVTNVVVATEVEYKTIQPNSYKRRSVHHRRHGHAL